jgi:hypothetical protein
MPPDRGQRTHWYAKLVGELVHEPLVAVSVAPTAAGPAIRGSTVFDGRSWITAEPPAGRARTVASDASAAAASVQTIVVLRVLRIALSPFVGLTTQRLTRIPRSRRTPYGTFTHVTNPSRGAALEATARARGTLAT